MSRYRFYRLVSRPLPLQLILILLLILHQEAVDEGIETDGSNLTCVSARCSWIDKETSSSLQSSAQPVPSEGGQNASSQITEDLSDEIRAALMRGMLNANPTLPPIRSADKYVQIPS